MRSGRGRPSSVDPARQAAFDALLRVETHDGYLNLVLRELLAGRHLSGRDAAFATELGNGTARWQGSYDAILDRLVRGGVDRLQPPVRVVLRLGAHQLLSLRVPAHAAVSTTVELVRSAVGERPAGLVNAVLRRVSERSLDAWLEECAPAADVDVVGNLAVRYSHPRWVAEAFLDRLGDRAEAEAALAADNDPPPVTLAVRPGLASTADLAAEAAEAAGPAAAGEPALPGRWSPYALRLPGGAPAALPSVRAGRAGVQDEGSQLAAVALARARIDGPDLRWLDLCAGPGGKAALLTGLGADLGARVLAVERQPHRAGLVARAARGYPRPPLVVVADGTRPAWPVACFDRVLVDVPCTGLGALRRRPDARWRRRPADLETLVPLQAALLTSAVSAVRPGGVVGYVTCSPLLAETREVVDLVLSHTAELAELDVRPLLPELADNGPGPHVQLWPHRHGTDAMFVALLRRADDARSGH